MSIWSHPQGGQPYVPCTDAGRPYVRQCANYKLVISTDTESDQVIFIPERLNAYSPVTGKSKHFETIEEMRSMWNAMVEYGWYSVAA